MRPYIGITDFTAFSQVDEMMRVFARHPTSAGRLLHVGVMMSYKTLTSTPTKWQNVFPPKAEISVIFSSASVYNALHYADYGEHLHLAQHLAAAILYGGPNLHALQLDMRWPQPSEVARAIELSRKQVEVILQIGSKALAGVEHDPLRLVWRLTEYDGVISRVLLDQSMGQGVGMDAYELLPFVRAIKEHLPALGVAVAGGLDPETINLVEPVIAEFPDTSIDAQGRLRPSGSALDPIDWSMASTYLTRALDLFAKYTPRPQ